MAATTTLMTWEAFEQLPHGDGFHRELIEGELQVLPPPKSGHTKIAKRAYSALLPAEEAGGGQVYIEAGYKLSPDPTTWLEPDVSFLRDARVRDTLESDYFLGAPELAIEVVSPPESAADLNRKVELYLRAGSVAVWVIYPKQRHVRVFLADGRSLLREANDMLSLPELLPGWEFPVSKLFKR
jgi:Uma2 family endonuclease